MSGREDASGTIAADVVSPSGGAAADAGYPQRMRASAELFARASKVIPGGAGSSARTVKFG
ncbi:MAG: hypothetical protein ACRDL5_09860, partial [Solirubrobacteraceae bacterium]